MNIVKERRSVRTYDGNILNDEDREILSTFAANADNPYNIPIEYRFLDPKKYGLKSPVLNGETLYLAAKLKRVPHFEEAFGYSFEAIVLKAWSMGIGTVWIGGTMNRPAFEKAMDLQNNEVMPCITPVGYPAKKLSIRESLMRKGVKADWRYEPDQLFFEEEAGNPLSAESKSLLGNTLEMVRWAPSAVNKQPWRVIVKGKQVHFYERPDGGYVKDVTGDLQRIDVGIALYHFAYGCQADRIKTEFSIEDPGLKVPGDWQYVATYTVL